MASRATWSQVLTPCYRSPHLRTWSAHRLGTGAHAKCAAAAQADVSCACRVLTDFEMLRQGLCSKPTPGLDDGYDGPIAGTDVLVVPLPSSAHVGAAWDAPAVEAQPTRCLSSVARASPARSTCRSVTLGNTLRRSARALLCEGPCERSWRAELSGWSLRLAADSPRLGSPAAVGLG